MGVAQTKHLLTHSSKGCMSEMKVSARLVPSDACEETSGPVPFPHFCGLLSNVISRMKPSPIVPLLSLHGSIPVCLSPKFPFFIRTPITLDQGPILPRYDLILTNSVCRDSFQIRPHSEVLGIGSLNI